MAIASPAASDANAIDRVRELAARLPARRAALPPPGCTTVSLLECDPDLAEAIPPADRERARRALSAPARDYPRGPLSCSAFNATTFAIVVTEGVLTERVGIGGHEMIELLIAQDIVLPWPPASPSEGAEPQLAALEKVRLVGLDHRFIRAASLWPRLMGTLHQRLADQRYGLATHGAICQLPRAEQRVMAIMWHLAGRIGKVTPEGTIVPWPRTHQALASLVGARRPTISLALKALHARGQLRARESGEWLLPRAPAHAPLDAFVAGLPTP